MKRRNPLFAWFLSSLLTACDMGTQPAPGCVGTLRISDLVNDALPEVVASAGVGRGGFVNNQHHAAYLVPAGKPRLEEPHYPVHTMLEFRFQTDIADPEAFHSRLCDAFERALEGTCDSVRRQNLYLACSFRTESSDRLGTLDILPNRPDVSSDLLIVVANEW